VTNRQLRYSWTTYTLNGEDILNRWYQGTFYLLLLSETINERNWRWTSLFSVNMSPVCGNTTRSDYCCKPIMSIFPGHDWKPYIDMHMCCSSGESVRLLQKLPSYQGDGLDRAIMISPHDMLKVFLHMINVLHGMQKEYVGHSKCLSGHVTCVIWHGNSSQGHGQCLP
jgi:hypothetical protein